MVCLDNSSHGHCSLSTSCCVSFLQKIGIAISTKYRAALTDHAYQHCGNAMVLNIARTVPMRAIVPMRAKIMNFSVPFNNDAFPKCGSVMGKLTARVMKYGDQEEKSFHFFDRTICF